MPTKKIEEMLDRRVCNLTFKKGPVVCWVSHGRHIVARGRMVKRIDFNPESFRLPLLVPPSVLDPDRQVHVSPAASLPRQKPIPLLK